MLEGHKQWEGKVKRGKGDSLVFRYSIYFTLLSLEVP